MNKDFKLAPGNYLALLLICMTCNVFAQRKAPVTITLDTNTGQISAEDKQRIPFDETFYLTGSFPKDKKIILVKVFYKLLGHCYVRGVNFCSKNNEQGQQNKGDKTDKTCLTFSRHYYFDCKAADEEGYFLINSDSIKTGSRTFELAMDPLHPNEQYEVKIEIYEQVDVNGEIKKNIRKEIINLLYDTYDFRKEKFSAEDFSKLNENVARLIHTELGSELFNDEGVPVDFKNLVDSNLEVQEVHKKVYTRYDDLNELFLALNGKEKNRKHVDPHQLIEDLNLRRDNLINNLQLILQDNFYAKLMEEPLNSSINTTITVKDALSFLLSDLQRWGYYDVIHTYRNNTFSNGYLIQILFGRGKWRGGKTIETAQTFDLISGSYLWSSFIFLQNLKDKNGNQVIPIDTLKEIVEGFGKWYFDVSNYQAALNDKQKDEQLGELYETLYSKYDSRTLVSTTEVFETKESNYIGLDFGVMAAPGISSTFVFEGFNFFLRPVNKNADFRKLRGTDKTLKRYSLSLGIAQRIGNGYNDSYENLIGVGSPFVGIGYRFKGFRISTGGMFYEKGNANPLISESSVNFTYFFGFSVDISFKDLVKTVIGI